MKSRGFSLIELMVVIAIMAMLSWYSIPKYQNYVLKTTVTTQALAAVRPIQMALMEYVALNGQLPSGFANLADIGFVNEQGEAYSQGAEFKRGAVSEVDVAFNASAQEVILGVQFNCRAVSASGCSKTAPEQLWPLTLEISAAIHPGSQILHFIVDKTRQANLQFKGFLPQI